MTNLIVFEQTDVGRVRDHNEDCVRTGMINGPSGEYHLWVVADGMGGGVRGEDASAIAVETLFDELGDGNWRDPEEALARAFQVANRNVHRMGTADGALTQSAAGTTITAALIHDGSATTWIANVGDSRAYLSDAHGLRQITEDHSYVAGLVSAGIITADEAAHASDRNVLTRAVGTEPKVTVDTFGPQQLQPGQRLLLCSDGLHGFVEPAQLDQMMRELPLAELPGALIEAANEGGGRDNITALVGALADPGATVLVPPPVVKRRDQKMLLMGIGSAVVFAGFVAARVVGFGHIGGSGAKPTPFRTSPTAMSPTSFAAGGGSVAPSPSATSTATATATSTATTTPRPSPSRTQSVSPTAGVTESSVPTQTGSTTSTVTVTSTVTITVVPPPGAPTKVLLCVGNPSVLHWTDESKVMRYVVILPDTSTQDVRGTQFNVPAAFEGLSADSFAVAAEDADGRRSSLVPAARDTAQGCGP
jgi:protein phosphatase